MMMKIVAVTACPSGIAHTYMAAMKLETTAQNMGYEIKVEKQGAKGIENELTLEDIKTADAVILAVNTKIKKEERFQNVQTYHCPVNAPIKNAQDVIESALQEHKKEKKQKNSRGLWIQSVIQTGFSYMVPFAVVATVLFALGQLLKTMIHSQSNIIDMLDMISQFGLWLILPIFSAYISYAIADKSGLVSGFIGGMLLKQMGAGFLGAILIGGIAGALTRLFINAFRFKEDYAGFSHNLVITFSTVLVAAIVYFGIGTPLSWLHQWTLSFFDQLSLGASLIIVMIISAMMGYDLGGVMNKSAMIIAVGLLESHIWICNSAAMISICVPPLGYGLYTLLFRHHLPKHLQKQGICSLQLGLIGISEGALPFTLVKPKVFVWINMIGCMIASSLSVVFSVYNPTLIAGIYGWFLIPSFPYYIMCVGAGALFIVLGSYVFRQSLKGAV